MCWCWEVGVFLGEIKFRFDTTTWVILNKLLQMFGLSFLTCKISELQPINFTPLYKSLFSIWSLILNRKYCSVSVSFHNIPITVTKCPSPTTPKRNNLQKLSLFVGSIKNILNSLQPYNWQNAWLKLVLWQLFHLRTILVQYFYKHIANLMKIGSLFFPKFYYEHFQVCRR